MGEELNNSQWLWFVYLWVFFQVSVVKKKKNLLCLELNVWIHTFCIVKRDEFVGLDVVNQGWHRLIGCYFLSSCALQGIDRKLSDVWTALTGHAWCEAIKLSSQLRALPHLMSSFSPRPVPLCPLVPRCPPQLCLPQLCLPLVKHIRTVSVTSKNN